MSVIFLMIVLMDPAIVAAQAAPPTTPAIVDGALVRGIGEAKIYYIESGKKRLVDSLETIKLQGLQGRVVGVSTDELARYEEGEKLTKTSKIVLPSEKNALPDLVPFPMQDIKLDTVKGRMVLRFSSRFWNQGAGNLQLVSHPHRAAASAVDLTDTFQRVTGAGGVFRDTLVGSFVWHAVHNHFHYNDFADYILEPLMTGVSMSAQESATPQKTATQKTTFCLRDDQAIDLRLKGAPSKALFGKCQKNRQGVSIGWADNYRFTLPDQFIDVADMTSGMYRLVFSVDPRKNFIEGRKDNNVSVVILDLNKERRLLRTIVASSAFAGTHNYFSEGMFVRASSDGVVYIINGNRKRALRTTEALESYNFSPDKANILPQANIDVIPDEAVVRAMGTSQLYLINAAGYRRYLVSIPAFASYKTKARDITQAEFIGYKSSSLIMKAGDADVYIIDQKSKRKVGTVQDLASLGYDAASVQVVTGADFNAYITTDQSGAPVSRVEVMAKDLNIPWDLALLPDGDMLVTERTGVLRRFGAHPGTITLPDVLHVGEGGLMGIALHPDFTQNNLLYLDFTTSANGKTNQVSRFRLEGNRLVDEVVIVDGIPSSKYHDGGQVAFGPDGMLYITTGDAEQPALAQKLDSLAGKILRLTPDGQIPADNPFGTAVWSYGHRNPQGIAWDGAGRMWATEHGRSGALSGFDELNNIEKGKNYGWPLIQGPEQKDGMVTPALNSGATSTWAPSGLAYLDGKLYFAGLRGEILYEVVLDQNGTVTKLEKHLDGVYGRIRAVVAGADGYLYITTSNRDGRGTLRAGDDKVLKVSRDAL